MEEGIVLAERQRAQAENNWRVAKKKEAAAEEKERELAMVPS